MDVFAAQIQSIPAPEGDKEEGSPVTEAARRAIEECQDRPERAAEVLEAMVRADNELRILITNPRLRAICNDVIRSVVRAGRKATWDKPTTSPIILADHRDAILRQSARNLLMFPLPGGKLLRDAVAADLKAACQFYQSQATNMAHKARWFELILKALPKDKTVGQAMDGAALVELQQKAGAS